jgi:hypothetical protein
MSVANSISILFFQGHTPKNIYGEKVVLTIFSRRKNQPIVKIN